MVSRFSKLDGFSKINMNSIILAIKPKYVKQILLGKKKYEFRHKRCSQNINGIYIYETAPTSKIVAYIYINDILEGPPNIIWNITKKYSGISEDEYNRYYMNRDLAYVYCIQEVIPFNPSLSLNDMGINAPPQSFIYTDFDFHTLC